MDIQAYKKYWSNAGETLNTYSPVQVDTTKIDNETFVFLTNWGLPSDAAPFLGFGEVQEGKLLTPNQILQIDFYGLDDYLMFGSNGSGDPICIDVVKQSEVVYLNHDNYFERIFINKSIMQLALCLIRYRDFILSLIDITSAAYAKRKFSDDEFLQLKRNFLDIDKSYLIGNSFWTAELDVLLWERDNE